MRMGPYMPPDPGGRASPRAATRSAIVGLPNHSIKALSRLRTQRIARTRSLPATKDDPYLP
jgi:hypothetical protein